MMNKNNDKLKNTGKDIKNVSYPQFSRIDGCHPFRAAVPNGYVDYSVRTRHGGEVFYFNFELAKEMGLIPRDHRHILYKDLCQAILDTFSLQIINEYDIAHNTPIPFTDIRENKYMATRYLQLQHPNKTGLTSGDGRTIWNGCFKGKNSIWDLSSCGTGVTCLSPATAIENDYFMTGDENASYGSGRSDFIDGVCAALMSDILHRNDIKTERTLAVIAFNDDTSINVRAATNLLRPAHFFYHVKQGNYAGLKGAIDYYIDRQVANKKLLKVEDDKQKYQNFLEQITIDFAIAAAVFESEYIFCWLDWDGDNILTDAGIIDYGSVRQFGLYHHEYRYDDVDRMSTTITEQKKQTKYIIKTFAQITDFLISGKKRPIVSYNNHRALKLFDQIFDHTKDEAVLYKMGLNEKLSNCLLDDKNALDDIRSFRKVYAYFERAKSKYGRYEVEDGINWDAIFCVRDIMRELPSLYRDGVKKIRPEEFVEILRSDYALTEDLLFSSARRKKINEFQKYYWRLVDRVVNISGRKTQNILNEMVKRSAIINRYERITGDSIIHLAAQLIKDSRHMGSGEMHQVFNDFVEAQVLRPEYFAKAANTRPRYRNKRARKTYESMLRIVKVYREGI